VGTECRGSKCKTMSRYPGEKQPVSSAARHDLELGKERKITAGGRVDWAKRRLSIV